MRQALGDVLAALDDIASRMPVGPMMFYSYRSGLTDEQGHLSGCRAAYYWATITGDPAWAKLAAALFQGQAVEKQQQKDDPR